MFLMIKRAIMCKPVRLSLLLYLLVLISSAVDKVIIKFFSLPDFEDLRLYYLDANEWTALQDLYDILSVSNTHVDIQISEDC